MQAVLPGIVKTLNAYIRKEEWSRINNLSSQLRKLEEKEQNKPKARRRKDIIRIKVAIGETE